MVMTAELMVWVAAAVNAAAPHILKAGVLRDQARIEYDGRGE